MDFLGYACSRKFQGASRKTEKQWFLAESGNGINNNCDVVVTRGLFDFEFKHIRVDRGFCITG